MNMLPVEESLKVGSQSTQLSHTPGPWSVTSCVDYWIEHSQPLTDADDGFKGIAHVGDISWPNSEVRQQEWEANARLIAAAPNLLALAKKYASECGNCNGRGYNTQAGEPFTQEASNNERIECEDCADIREVIAKAVRS